MHNATQAKSVSQSRTLLTELMVPSYSNFGGKVHGGIMLSLMDKAAYACATRHSETYCVTVAMDDIVFRYPVEVGNLVSLEASVHYVGNTSMVIGIEVNAENTLQRQVRHTNTCYVTMVAQDKDGKSCQVPPLLLESELEVQRFFAAIKRQEANQALQHKLGDLVAGFDMDFVVRSLSGYRCVVELPQVEQVGVKGES